MTTEKLDHPEFLIRANWTPERIREHEAAWAAIDALVPRKEIEKAEPQGVRFTARLREEVAHAVIHAVKNGNDTFGKIRKQIGDRYEDKVIRSGIKKAKEWHSMVSRHGSRNKPSLRHYQARITSEGRRYTYIEA